MTRKFSKSFLKWMMIIGVGGVILGFITLGFSMAWYNCILAPYALAEIVVGIWTASTSAFYSSYN